ncbi:hypothetical protein MKX01_030645, partial [Papaver californicum]
VESEEDVWGKDDIRETDESLSSRRLQLSPIMFSYLKPYVHLERTTTKRCRKKSSH